jgi:hypothetical protein
MAEHIHTFALESDGSIFASLCADKSAIVVVNVAGRPLEFGKPLITLAPGDTAASCDDNARVLAAIKAGHLRLVKSSTPKQEQEVKAKKQKTEQVAETKTVEVVTVIDEPTESEKSFETVAAAQPEDSVQLNSSSGATQSSDEL